MVEEILSGKTEPLKNTSKEESKKIRGQLMIVDDTEVPKAIFDKYEESQKIMIHYDSTNPKKIKIK